MGQLQFVVDQPAIVASQRENVVLFDPRRRAAHIRGAADARPRAAEGVVVRLPVAYEGSRQTVHRAEQGAATERPASSGSSDTGFTTLDFVATAFLILSVFSAPALVWTLVRSASLG
jgi:hypothetical protein